MRALFIWISLSLAALLSLVLVTALLLWLRPQIVLNTANLERALPFAHSRLDFIAEAPRLEAFSESFWTKRLHLQLDRFCLQGVVFADHACVRAFDLDLGVQLRPGESKLFLIHSLSAELEPMSLRSAPKQTAAPEPKEEDISSWPRLLRRIAWEKIEVRAPNVEIPSDDGPFQARASVSSENSSHLRIQAAAELPGKKKQNFSFDGVFRSDLLAQGPSKASSSLSAKLTTHLSAVEAQATLEAKYLEPNLEMNFDGHARLKASTDFDTIVRNCTLAGQLNLDSPDLLPFDSFSFQCPIEAQPLYNSRTRKHFGRSLPRSLKITTQLRASRDARRRLKAELDLDLTQIRTPLFNADAHAQSRSDDVFASGRSKLLDLNIDAHFEVPHFRQAAALSNEMGLLVPAPFHVLEGPLTTSVKGTFSLPGPEAKLKIALRSKLKSKDQTLALEATGDVGLKTCIPPGDHGTINIDLVAQKAQLSLPDINYTQPPAILPDSRFAKEGPAAPAATAAKKTAGCSYDLSFSFKNAPRNPILLDIPVLANPVPLEVDLRKHGDQDGEGSLAIQNYSTELFRRRAVVENFRYDLGSKLVEGRVRVDYVDYRIFVLLTGKSDSIQVNFDSEPPLTRQSAISVLLFGRPIDSLDDGQSDSVVNVDAAAKNGALSLASLYLFASTPIESVDYRPETQGVSAKIKLADGTSLNVGVNQEAVTDVGITRRLSPHWRIESTVRNPNDPAGRASLTILEWFKRF